MPTYRLEAWITHRERDLEDELERRIKSALYGVDVGVSEGPVVFRIYPNGDSDPLP